MNDSTSFLNFLNDSPGGVAILERFYEGSAGDVEFEKHTQRLGSSIVKKRKVPMAFPKLVFPQNDPLKDSYRYDAFMGKTEILWKCLKCGELKPRNHWVLGDCPACGAKKLQFVLVAED